MNITYKDKVCHAVKHSFYCKAGAYEHKTRIGWVLADPDGTIVLGDRKVSSSNSGAYRHEYPVYRTRKELILSAEYYHKEWEKQSGFRHTYDEHGRCFECDAPKLETVGWCKDIAPE